MPDKRYSLKVNGKNRTVKADVFNDNIGKFINDMPDATIMMQGQDGTTREYKLRDIADAYDAGYSFLETDTPIYVNSKPPQHKPAAAPQPKPAGETAGTVAVTQEAAQAQQSQQQAAQMQQAMAQQPAQPPFFTAENPSPLQPKEEEKISLTPFADKMKEIRQLSESPDLNKEWAARQQESERRMVEPSQRGFAYTAEGMKQAEEADAARRLNRSKYDEQHFDDFYDRKVAPIFGEERTAGAERARREADALPNSPMPGAVGGLFGKAVAYEKHTDPQKIADATIGRVQKDDSFGDYVMARMGIDTKAESADGATVPQLSEREKEWINRLFAKESGEVAEQIQQRIYDQYQKENAPQGTLDYIMGKAFHENLAATLGEAIVRRAAHSSGMREQLRAMASEAYGREQSWGVRVAGGAAPFAVDMVAGGFALPNLVGEAVVKGGVGMAARQVTQQMAKRAAARGLEGAALKEATSGAAGVAERYLATQAPIVNLAVRTAGSAANFATYDMQAEVVRQIGEGEFRPFDLLKEAVHGAVLGGAMGVAGGTIGHMTRNASSAGKVMGGVAGLGAETTIFGVSNGLAKAQADGEDISNVDWADTMGEAFGQVVGMKAVGVAMHPRQFLNRYRKSKDYDLQLNQRDIDELREAGYDFGSIIKGLGTFGDTAPMEANVVSRAKEYTAGPDGTGRKRETTSEEAWVDAEAYEAIMRNPEVSSSTKRKLAYIATGKVLMPEPVFGVQMNVGDDGKATVTTLNAYGQPIETKDYDSEDAARKDYGELQSVSKRNTIDGLERIAARAGFPDLVDGARQRTMNETGSDVDEVLTSEQRDREAADAILDNYIKNLQEAYMQRFNEKLRQLGGREGGDRGEEPQPAGEAAGEGAESTPPPTGEGVDNASGEAGAASGTGADNPPAPPANPPSSAGTADSETMSRRDAAYDRGASVKDDSSILPAINYEVKLADARLAALFPDGDGNLSRLRKAVMDAVESGDDDTADKVIEAAKGRLTAQQLEALEQYRDLMETQRGVEDAVTTQTEAFEEQRRAELQAVAASDGTVTPIELQDGRTAYYKAGDLRNKYGGIVVAHEDGTTEQIPTSAVRSIGESQKVDDIVNADIEEYANDIREGYEGLANGTIFHPGATVDFVIGGKMVRATVAGQDAAGNPVFTLDDGSQMPMMQADARRAIAEADKIKIQAQLQQEREAAVAQQQTERYKKGIVGFAEGKPDYAAEGSDPQVVAEYLKSMSQDPSNNGPILKNIEGEEALIMQNAQQAYDEWQRAENAIEMSDDDLRKKAKAIQDRQGAVQRLVELERQRRKWGEIRQAIMTPEERLKYEGARQGNYNKALAAVKKYRETNPREPAGETTGTTAQPIPTAQELFSQHQEQSDAMNAVTALRKEAAREWNDELQPELQKVRGAISDYQRGLTEYDEEGLKELADAQTELEEREQALLARNRELKNLEKALGRMYASRDNAELTPHERKMNQLGREKDRVKKMQLAKQAFVDDPIAAEILENDEPTDVYEFVARNLGYGSLNWEGLERGEHHVRGVQEMMGRDKTRSLEKGSDTYGFNAYLAPTGEGMGFDEAVHSIYESQPDREDGTKAYSTEDIANALEDMLRTATRPTDISHRIENDRIAQAEQVYRANEEREREEAAEAEAEYMEYLETLRGLIPTEEAENYISGLMADEIAEIEADREAYREAMRQMMPDEQEPAREPADAAANNQNNIQDGETANQPQPAVTGSGRVDKQPQPAAVESGVGEGQTPVQGTEANQPASETGRTKQPATQPAGARKGAGPAHADQGTPVPPESAGDLEAPKELADRISISEDYTEGEGENGKIYLTPVTIDGTYEVVKVDEPDAKGNYSGSYYEYEGKRFGDLNEVVRHIDGVTKPKDETKGESLMHVPFSERLKAAKGETDTNPTEAQKAAGNYKMGHIQFGGYRMSIENPKGSVRSGRDANGNPWSITMQDTYGYIGRKYGADGDHLDFFINDDADLDNWSGRVYVVDQKNLDGTFDEHKVMYGYPNWAAAKKAYERNYEPGWWDSRVMQMMGVPKERFDKWLADSDHKTKPYAEYFRLKYDNPVSDPVSDMLATVQERKEAGEKAMKQQKSKQQKINIAATTPTEADIAARDVLIEEYLRPAGIKVNTDIEDAEKILAAENTSATFHKVTDKDTLKQLDEGSTVKRLRAMQMVDGKLYPPMSGKVDGQWREPTEIGVWEQSEERPDLLDKNGKFVLKKGLKGEGRGDTPAAYNPYFHTSTSGLNDQFTAAYKRPELVVVEVEIPESELTSGYQAQGAKDHVGDIPWHSGPVNGALPNDRKRTVTLSRWSKVVRVVPDGEVADMVAKQLEGTGVEVPYNVVTPSLRKELEARGVKISSTPAGTVTEDINGNPIKKSGQTIKKQKATPPNPEAAYEKGTDVEYDNGRGKKLSMRIHTPASTVQQMKPTEIEAHSLTRDEQKKLYQSFQPETNSSTGETVEFYNSAFGKNHREGGLFEKIVPQIRELFKESKLIYSEKESLKGTERRDGSIHKEHRDVVGYGNYLNRVTIDGKDYYVRFTVQRKKGESGLHSSFVSSVDLYENPAEVAYDPSSIGRRRLDFNRITDAKLRIYFEKSKETDEKFAKAQDKDEKTLMGVHNVSEEKLRKIIKQGGLANPSLAVIDTKNHIHTDYGEISLIPKSSLIDAKKGRNAGTWTADAWTPTYPQVTKRMSSKGQDKYWTETRKTLGDEPGDIRSKTMMAFESWMENGTSPERLSYWYLKERGRKPEHVMYEPSMAKEDIEAYHQAMGEHDRFSELDEAGRKAVLALIAKDRGETPEEMAAKMQELKERNTQRMNDENVKAFIKMRAERVIGEIDEYGVPYSYISDYDYKVRNAERTDGKLNVDATLGKAAELVKSEGLEEDFGKWLEEKEKSYGIEEWLYNGTDSEGRQKWVRNTLENASKLMKKQGRNGAHGMATGNLIATVAKRVTTLDQIRKERGNLNTTFEEHEAFKEQWGDALLELCNKCGDELWVGEARLQEALGEKNPVAYLKKEYGVELSKEDAELLNTFIKEVRENFPTGYFETKFERPVGLDEFEIAVVPSSTSPEVVKALKDAGLEVHTYEKGSTGDQDDANRRQAVLDAVKGRDDIRFFKTKDGEAYGFVKDGEIYVDPRIAKADTPIHEYGHLWAEAVRQANPEEWKNIVELMKGYNDEVSSIWAKVQEEYPELESDDDVAEEVLTQYSGKRGKERIDAEYKAAEMAGETDADQKSKARRLIDRVKEALTRFWRQVADFLHIHYTSAEDVADQVLRDFLNKVNPTKEAKRYSTENGRIEMDAKSNGTFMTAPDGSRSKLSEKQWVAIRTKGFKKWIGGDWEKGGKDFDGKLGKNGEPLEKYVTGYMERPRKPGKPKQKQGETLADYLQRLRLWEKATKEWPETEAQWKAVVAAHEDKDLPDEEAIKAAWEEKYQSDLAQWKADNGLPSDAEPPSDMPKADTDPLEYIKSMADYRRREALWKTAPRQEDYERQAEDELYTRLAERDMKKYPLSHSARMKGIGASLTELRRAVARQKRYDQDTVKSVADFAKQFMMLGFGDNLGRGDIEKLLSAVRNATGARSVKPSIDKILDTLVDNHLRNLDSYIWKMASVKELKQNAAGVEVQGKLELKGQRMIQAFRKAIEGRDTADELEERLNEIAGKMTSDPEQATMWEAEFDGVQAALQYRRDIDASREEWESLNTERKDAEKEYGKSGRSYEQQQQLLEELDKAMAENKIERIGLYGRMIDRLGGLISGSMEGAHEFVEREKQRVAEIHRIANYDTAGKDMGAFHKEDWKQRLSNSSVPRFFLGSLATFEQMMRQFGARNPNGEGYLYNHFMRKWIDATNHEWTGVKKAKEILDAKAAEIFGKKGMRWSDLYTMERKMPTVDVEIIDQGEPKTFRLTQGNMLYIYMANKMNDGAMKLRKMGIMEEDVDRLKEEIDPRLLQLADWLQDEYLSDRRKEYNKTHERLFGAPMAAIDHYFPLRILSDARIKDEDVANTQDGDSALPSTATGAIVKRTKNSLPLDILNGDALSIAIEHVEEMEKWNAFAEWNKDINTLLSYTPFRNKVKNMTTIYGSGEQLWQTFRATAQMAAGTYKPKVKPGSVDKTISNMAKGVTAAKISFRVYTAIKQILSAPAFLHDTSPLHFAKCSVTPWESWKWAMENMPVFEKRWKSRQVGDTRLMDNPTDWKLWQNNVVKLAAQWGMTPNAFVDGVTCAVGAHAIYKTRIDRYLKQGLDELKAKQKALQDAEIGYNLTQQSSEGAMVSEIQMQRTIAANMLSVFRNSSMAYTRQTVDALRNLKHRMRKDYRQEAVKYLEGQLMEEGLDEGKAKAAARAEYRRGLWHDLARVVVAAWLLPIFWNLGSSLPYLVFGDDDEEKKKMGEDALIKGFLAGPVEGLVSGNIVSDLTGLAATHEGISIKGIKDYEMSPLPLFSDIKGVISEFGYDKVAALEDIFNIGVQSMVGVNPQTATDFVNACIDYGRGDMGTSKEIALFIMRVLNVPTTSWRNIYIDELGMNAEEARKLSYEQMAERYATYMMQKNTPLFGWLYNDEEEKKRRDSYMRKFDEKVKERMGNMDQEEMESRFNQTESEKEKKLLGKVAAKQAETDDTEHSPEYLRLRTWEDMNGDLAVTKMYRETAETEKDFRRLKAEHADNATMNQFMKEHQRELERRQRIAAYRRAAGAMKKSLGKGNDDRVMEQIRQQRRDLLNSLGNKNE